MPAKRLEKEEKRQAGATGTDEELNTRKKNVPGEGDGEIVGIEDPTEAQERIEDPVDEDEEDLEDEEEEQAEDAETSGA